MERSSLDGVPAAIVRAVKTAPVAPHVRAMFAHLPQRLRLDAHLPDDAERIPLAARQLVKIGLMGEKVALREVTAGDGALSLTVALGERRCTLGFAELSQELRVVIHAILGALFEGSDVTRLLESFASQSSSLATTHQVTRHMLRAPDIDRALYVMLSGITSGSGLGLNRAALFLLDPSRAVFVGKSAIGPADAAEAHRIWEEIEHDDLTIEHHIEDYSAHRTDTRFQNFVESVELRATGAEDDELVLAGSQLLFRTEAAPKNRSLARLTPAPEFILTSIASHGEVKGMLFADNLYSGTPIDDELVRRAAFYIEQTSLVWDNLSLLQEVDTLARHDALTGVFNRRELETRFAQEKSRCQRSGASLSLMILDIDLFKAVNDKKGHAEGDATLRTLGALLQKTFRGHDVVARYGGDEFVVLLPDATGEHLTAASRRIGALARDAGISLSIGGATLGASSPSDGEQALFVAADAELYRAKDAGRGCAFVSGQLVKYGD